MMALLLGLGALGAAIYPGAAGTTRAPRLENITIYHVNPEVRPFALRTHTHQPRNFRSLFDFGEAGAFFFCWGEGAATGLAPIVGPTRSIARGGPATTLVAWGGGVDQRDWIVFVDIGPKK